MNATWTKNPDPDSEYGSHIATYKGHRLEVSTDKDETDWSFNVDGGDNIYGHDTREEAMKKAEKEVDLMEKDKT